MNDSIIIPENSDLFRSLEAAVQQRRLIFLAGIPGVGKSLYVQQLVLMAQAAGKTVHLLQYDVSRVPFEHHPDYKEKYPEIDGVSHPMMRKAVGIWAREAALNWFQAFGSQDDLLIGEVPLIGSRLIELVQKIPDAAEPLLAGKNTLFIIPVPSKQIRQKIVSRRRYTIENPRNEKETKDAQINVLTLVWEQAYHVAEKLGLVEGGKHSGEPLPYDPAVYAAVYEYLCRERHTETLHIDLPLNPPGSVYDWETPPAELRPTSEEAAMILKLLERRFGADKIEQMVNTWFD